MMMKHTLHILRRHSSRRGDKGQDKMPPSSSITWPNDMASLRNAEESRFHRGDLTYVISRYFKQQD